LEITEDCCATARQLIAGGFDPDERLEFYRGNMLCLRGTARAFASRMFTERGGRPRHVRYDLVEGQRLADLKLRGRPPVRQKDFSVAD
jgi:hypothetical protein